MLAEQPVAPAAPQSEDEVSGVVPIPATPEVRHPRDLALLQGVAAGDVESQRLLAARLVRRVRRAAAAIMRGSPDAEDAAQHALIEIFRSCHNYRGDSSLERWSDRICGRSVIRFARRLRKRQSVIEPESDPDRLADLRAPDPRSESLRRGVREYLAQLSESRRDTLVLKHGLGHSVKEIAEITGVSPNTVKDRLQAAKFEMRRMMQRDSLGVAALAVG